MYSCVALQLSHNTHSDVTRGFRHIVDSRSSDTMDKYLIRSSSFGSLNSKRPAEDNLEGWTTPKRHNIQSKQSKFDGSRNLPTSNRFEELPVDDQCSKYYQDAATKPKKLGHIPPILVDVGNKTHLTIKETVSKFTKTFHLQYRSGNKVAVICYSSEAHQAVKEGLRTDDVPFVTYTRSDEKTPKVVIKGLPTYAEEELPSELEKLGFKGAKVTKLKLRNAVPCPPYLVQLADGADIVKFRQIKYLCNCVVTIQKYKPKRSAGTQCYRCQNFGHSSKNCNMPSRCVKCTELHSTADCSKKDRKEVARCCNCNEEHPANYSKCKVRLAYLDRIHQNTYAHKTVPLLNIPKPVTKSKTWASVAAATTTDENETEKDLPKITVGPEEENPLYTEDAATNEMFKILLTLRKIKKQFTSCTSQLEKVMLVLTHLGQYI